MTLWSRLTGWMVQHGASVNQRPASPRRRSVVLRFEQLEDRLVPSGGPGTTSTSGGSGTSGGSSGGPTVVSTSTATPVVTFTINLSAVTRATGPSVRMILLRGPARGRIRRDPDTQRAAGVTVRDERRRSPE